jgi:transcriptional regulator with XRE-family HTH domain
MKWHEKLRFARKVLRLSLRSVENETGISNPYLCQLENGQIISPSFFKINKLLRFYNLKAEDIEDSPEQKEPIKANLPPLCGECNRFHHHDIMCEEHAGMSKR